MTAAAVPLFLLLLEARQAELRYQLPPLLLAAVVLAESGGRQRLVTPEHSGHCSAGAAQVLIRGCDHARLQRLLVLSTNLDRGAAILASSARTCSRHPNWEACRRSRWARYNTGSRTWWPRVAAIWRQLLWRRGGEA